MSVFLEHLQQLIYQHVRSIEQADIDAIYDEQNILDAALDHDEVVQVLHQEDERVDQVLIIIAEVLLRLQELLNIADQHWPEIFVPSVDVNASAVQKREHVLIELDGKKVPL